MLSVPLPVHEQVTGALNVTGVPDAQGNLPKIIGGGSNRLFKVESGGELVVKSLLFFYLILIGKMQLLPVKDSAIILKNSVSEFIVIITLKLISILP